MNKIENKKVSFITLGCKVNQYETNAMSNMFENAGFEVVDFTEKADIYIINTCTVTGMSDKKSRQMIRRAKQINPNSIICAVGCYAQVSKDVLEKMDEIDLILGNKEKKDILNKVCEYLTNHKKCVEVSNLKDKNIYEEYDGKAYSSHIRAEIKIQDGCDNYCTYCIIPYARGPICSRKKEDILNEIKCLCENDIKEVVLTGIHISSYGKDLNSFSDNLSQEELEYRKNHYIYNYGLIDLLEDISKIEKIKRIRLGSIEPRLITKDFVERIKRLDKVCNHFHLSLQSGCDETLKRMNRKYNTKEFLDIVNLLRENIKDVAITTDVIVGFPGETDNEFETTKDFLTKIKLSKMHIFKYSKRKGTPAANFSNQVDESIKNLRSDILIDINNKNEEAYASKYIGKEIDVLFENELEGHTTNYIKVILNKKRGEEKPKIKAKSTTFSKQYDDIVNKIVTVVPDYYKDGALIIDKFT